MQCQSVSPRKTVFRVSSKLDLVTLSEDDNIKVPLYTDVSDNISLKGVEGEQSELGSGVVHKLTHRTQSLAASDSKPTRWHQLLVHCIGKQQCLLLTSLVQAHDLCALAHLDQVMSCKDSRWLLSQTFPEACFRVTRYSDSGFYSELPPTPEERERVETAIYPTQCSWIFTSGGLMALSKRN